MSTEARARNARLGVGRSIGTAVVVASLSATAWLRPATEELPRVAEQAAAFYTVDSVSGSVEVLRPSGQDLERLGSGATVAPDSLVETGSDGSVALSGMGGSLQLAPGARARTDNQGNVTVIFGRVLRSGGGIELRTLHGQVTDIQGSVAIDASRDSSRVRVTEGSARLAHRFSSESVALSAAQTVTATQSGLGSVDMFDSASELLSWTIPGVPRGSFNTPSALEGPVCGGGGAIPGIMPTVNAGTPDANGFNMQDQFSREQERRAITFRVPTDRSAYVYVGDQWYDLDLSLYSISLDQGVACWQTTGARARSERRERRAIQFIRPDEQILEDIEPGYYALIVGVAPNSGFDPARSFSVRVALSAPICGPLSPANVPNPQYPNVMMRADDAWYQLGITIDPPENERGPFALLTYTAVVSPPYLDLYEFDWYIDGRKVDGVAEPTIQEPASHIPRPPHVHRVAVTARGVRDYPDPDQPHRPPTLSTECTFLAP